MEGIGLFLAIVAWIAFICIVASARQGRNFEVMKPWILMIGSATYFFCGPFLLVVNGWWIIMIIGGGIWGLIYFIKSSSRGSR
ncbi:hypothetical protein SAMN02799624_05255 [Paenibacillus sp. UNC496MF]|nr:hypothetical protein SAMN02799624_05255 [Paenibacillus sp. UNC496MF]